MLHTYIVGCQEAGGTLYTHQAHAVIHHKCGVVWCGVVWCSSGRDVQQSDKYMRWNALALNGGAAG